MDTYPTIALPETFKGLQKIPVDKVSNFLCLWIELQLTKKLKDWALKL